MFNILLLFLLFTLKAAAEHSTPCPPRPANAVLVNNGGCDWYLPEGPYGVLTSDLAVESEEVIKFDTCSNFYPGATATSYPISLVGLRRNKADSTSGKFVNSKVTITFYVEGGPTMINTLFGPTSEFSAVSIRLKVKSKKNNIPIFKKYVKVITPGDYSTEDGFFVNIEMPAGVIRMDKVKKFKAVLKLHSSSYPYTPNPISCGIATRDSGRFGLNAFESWPHTTTSLSYTNNALENTDMQCVDHVTSGDTLKFSTCGHTVGDSYIRLNHMLSAADHNGYEVAVNDDGCDTGLGSELTYTATSTGRYCLKMGCFMAAKCTYTVDLTHSIVPTPLPTRAPTQHPTITGPQYQYLFDGCPRGGGAQYWNNVGNYNLEGCQSACTTTPGCNAIETNGCGSGNYGPDGSSCYGACYLMFGSNPNNFYNGGCDASGNQKGYKKL